MHKRITHQTGVYMKHERKYLVGLCLVGAMSTQAQAQGLSFYALLDGGIANTKVSGGVTQPGKTEFVTGGYAPTFAGIKGEKSLGSGYAGGFQLEQGFLLNPDSSKPWFFSDTKGLFNRRANVYVKSSAGTLTLGTQGNAFFSSLLSVEPRAGSNFGSSLATIAGDGQSYMGTVDKGAVSYASPVMSGVSVTAQYLPANVSTDVKSGHRFGVNYAKDSLTLTAATYTTDIAATAPAVDYTRTGALAGGAYKLGDFTLKGMWVKQTTQGFSNLKTTGVGGLYQLTPALGIDLGVYESKDAAAGYQASTVGTGVQYQFIKDLTAYAQYSNVKNKGTIAAAYNFAPPMAVDNGTLGVGQTGSTISLGLLYGFF